MCSGVSLLKGAWRTAQPCSPNRGTSSAASGQRMSSPRPAGTYGGGKVGGNTGHLRRPYWDKVGPDPIPCTAAPAAPQTRSELNNCSIPLARNSVHRRYPFPDRPMSHTASLIFVSGYQDGPGSRPSQQDRHARAETMPVSFSIPSPDNISVIAGSERAACRSKSSGS